MAEDEPFTVRRILLALDASSHSLAAAEAVAELAARWGAELQGLFVEDEALLSLSELPFARWTDASGVGGGTFDRARLEREYRVLARRAEEALASAARRWQVRQSFVTVRGQPEEAVLTAARSCDLVVLEPRGRPLGRYLRVATVAERLVRAAPTAVLLLQWESVLGRGVLVVHADTPGSWRALAAARRLAEHEMLPLRVLLLSDDPAKGLTFEDRTRTWLEGADARVRRLAGRDTQPLYRAIREAAAGLVVVGEDLPLLSSLEPVLKAARTQVLVVR